KDFSIVAGAAAYDEKKSEIDILSANISWPISITPSDFKILKNYESQLCEVLQDKFGCVSTLVSPALEDHTKSLRVFRKMLIPGLEVSVWKDDLTTHVVDAVVNAANERLQHLGGLALALVEAGGPEIEEDSRSHIVRHGKVTTGTIAITRAGRLPCKWIIHAVGPYWTGRDGHRCAEELECAIRHILDYVNCKNLHVKAVAIPALSSGIFQFPLNLCTRIIVETIRKYFGMKPVAGNLKEIHLVSNEDPTVASFKTASENILGKNELESLVSQEAAPPLDTMVVNNPTLQIVKDHTELQNPKNLKDSVNLFKISQLLIFEGCEFLIRTQFVMSMSMNWQAGELFLLTEIFFCLGIYHSAWQTQYMAAILSNVISYLALRVVLKGIALFSFPKIATANTIYEESVLQIRYCHIMIIFLYLFTLHVLTLVVYLLFPRTFSMLLQTFSAEMAKDKSMLSSVNNFSASQWTREEKRENGLKANSPVINLMGSNNEEMREAEAWIWGLLIFQGQYTIENNHILYLGKKEHDILSQLQKTSSVSISEIIDSGKAKLEIKGAQADVIEVVMNIEHTLCDVQEEVAKKKERDLWSLLGQWTGQQPKNQDERKENINPVKIPLTFSTQALQDKKKQFEKCGFQVIKVEKINNEVLSAVFQAKKKMMEGKARKEPVSHSLFQRVPRQFCNVVCRAGFQRMYQMPCADSKYGAGIYFTKNLKSLADQIKKTPATDKLIYVFEAEVLTGSFCQGCQSNIVPPPLIPGAIDSHDSVVDSVFSPETFVIFSGTQALPQYLWTCTQD
uniref:Poly(ADP-ribose) polymerase family member 9 n=1 Tax=Loxodonta africana TaxID=9785 RepID=G3TIU9_LOXAF